MKHTSKHKFVARKSLLLVSVIGLAGLTGCGDGGTSTGGGIFSGGCDLTDPDFPFCGADLVRCRNQDQRLYQVFDGVCPASWTVVPDDVAFPNLACTNPEGQTFNVDADQCPPGWTEFMFNLSRSAGRIRNN